MAQNDDAFSVAPDFNGPPAPYQDDRPDAEEHVRLYDPESKAYFAVPVEHASTAIERGAVPAWDKTKPPQEWAPWESALAGVAQGGLLGHTDEAMGAGGALIDAAKNRSFDDFGERYRVNRDDARARLAEADAQNHKSFTGGQLVGTGTIALLAPGGLPGALALGALQGEGNSTAEDAGGAARDAAVGAAGGAAGLGAGKVLGAGITAAAPFVKNLAAKALISGAGIGAKDLGAATGEDVVKIGRAALDEPGLVPGVFSKQGASAENLAANSAKATENAGQRMGANHAAFDAAHGPTVSARGLAEEIRDATSEAVRVKPEMRRHVARSIRQIDPEVFDAFEQSLIGNLAKAKARVTKMKLLVQEDPTASSRHVVQAERSVTRAKEALKAFGRDPSVAYGEEHGLTHSQTQEVINRLKGLGAHAGSPGETPITAKDSVLTPAWNTGANAIRRSAAAFGGEEALAAENAAREHYGNMISFKHGAEAAAQRAAGAPKPTAGLMDLAKAGAANMLDPHLGPLVLAGQAVKHAAGPRSAAVLNATAQALPKVGNAVADLMASHGALFSGKPQERRIAIDNVLQETNPRYREKRRKAEEEVQAAKSGGTANGSVKP